jgi:hypothetical protein
MLKIFIFLIFLSQNVFSFECTEDHIAQMNQIPSLPKGCKWECVDNQPTVLKQTCTQIEESLNCENVIYENKNVDRLLTLNLSPEPSERNFEVFTKGVLNGGRFSHTKYECELTKLNWNGESQPVMCEDYTVQCKMSGKYFSCEDLKEIQREMKCHPSFMEF